MDFSKKLKQRLYVAMAYIALGGMMLGGYALWPTDNGFIFSFGVALVVMGIVRIIRYRRIVRDKERMKRQEVAEKDERNLMIDQRAKGMAFAVYLMIAGIAVIALSLTGLHGHAQPIAYSVCILMLIYWACYHFASKRC